MKTKTWFGNFWFFGLDFFFTILFDLVYNTLSNRFLSIDFGLKEDIISDIGSLPEQPNQHLEMKSGLTHVDNEKTPKSWSCFRVSVQQPTFVSCEKRRMPTGNVARKMLVDHLGEIHLALLHWTSDCAIVDGTKNKFVH